MPLNWRSTKEEHELTYKIAKRAVELIWRETELDYDLLTAQMDISAVHLNGNPLKLQELLYADEANFLHDILGIRRHLNRRTGELEDFFSPRYSQPEK